MPIAASAVLLLLQQPNPAPTLWQRSMPRYKCVIHRATVAPRVWLANLLTDAHMAAFTATGPSQLCSLKLTWVHPHNLLVQTSAKELDAAAHVAFAAANARLNGASGLRLLQALDDIPDW